MVSFISSKLALPQSSGSDTPDAAQVVAIGYFADRDPFIEIRLSGARDHPLQPLHCLIDTCFTGAIQIPETSAPEFGLKEQSTVEMFYGDPVPVIRPAALGIADIDGGGKDVGVVIG